MIIGATVFAGLVLLLLVAERGSSFLWHGGSENATFYCTPCDLRYPQSQLDDRVVRTCPRGHPVQPVPQGFPFNTFFIALCAAFIGLGILLIATGRAP